MCTCAGINYGQPIGASNFGTCSGGMNGGNICLGSYHCPPCPAGAANPGSCGTCQHQSPPSPPPNWGIGKGNVRAALPRQIVPAEKNHRFGGGIRSRMGRRNSNMQQYNKNQNTIAPTEHHDSCCWTGCSGFWAWVRSDGYDGYTFYGNTAETIPVDGCTNGCQLSGGSMESACFHGNYPNQGDNNFLAEWYSCSCSCPYQFGDPECPVPDGMSGAGGRNIPPAPKRIGGHIKRNGGRIVRSKKHRKGGMTWET